MAKQLWANIRTNLKFYRRNKLLLLIGLFFLFIWGVSAVPALFYISNRQKFEIIQMILDQSGWFINFFVAALGVLTLFHHLSSRSYKMVVTKPCAPETWLLANFLSAMLVSALLNLAVLVLSAVLFAVWSIPFQWGVAYIALDGILRSAILSSILSYLTILVHPFIAVLAVLVINEYMFYQLIVLVSAGLKNATLWSRKVFFAVVKYGFYVLYLLVPTLFPLALKTQKIYSGLKMRPSDLKYLGTTFAYTLVICALLYFLSDYSLKKKRLI
jgi:hypothetical protein